MEGYTLRQQPLAALRGPSPLLRLAGDERLIALTRAGQQAAFEALVARYQARLLAFLRHMLRSREDAEDVLQEVFAAAFNAIMADSREINARPWLYRIARNRALNHLRRNTAIAMDSMDVHFADAGQSTSEKAHNREEFRLLVEDIGHLPETQRTALVLREMEALSYEQIADVMDTTVPSIKSLLVRARIGLAEAAEARKLTCDEVRFELGEAAEGLRSTSAPVRRHLKQCDRCRGFRGQLRANNRALAAIMPIGPLVLLKKTLLVKLGLAKVGAGSAGATGSAVTATAAGSGAAATAGGAAVGGSVAATTGGGIAAGAIAAKAVVVVAAATIVAVGSTKIFHAPAHRAPAIPTQSASVPTAAPANAAAAAAAISRHHMPAQLDLPAIHVDAGTFAVTHVRYGSAYVRHHLAAVTPAIASTPVDTTPADTSQPATTVTPAPVTTTPAAVVTPAVTPTPTTQEISTTTVFPGGTGGNSTATGSTGASSPGSTATTGASGATGATGSTGAAASTGSTGASGSTGGIGAPAQGTPTTGASGSGS